MPRNVNSSSRGKFGTLSCGRSNSCSSGFSTFGVTLWSVFCSSRLCAAAVWSRRDVARRRCDVSPCLEPVCSLAFRVTSWLSGSAELSKDELARTRTARDRTLPNIVFENMWYPSIQGSPYLIALTYITSYLCHI